MIIQNNLTSLPQNKMRQRQINPTFKGIGKITHIEYHQLGEKQLSELKNFIPNLEELKAFFQEKGIIDENNNFLKRAKKIIIEDGVDQLPETLEADEIIMIDVKQENLIGDKITLGGHANLTQKAEAKEMTLKDQAESIGNITTEHMMIEGNAKNKGQIDASKNVHMHGESENHGTILSDSFQMWANSKNMEKGVANNKRTWLTNSAENHGQINCVEAINLRKDSKNMETGRVKTDHLRAEENADNDGKISSNFSFITTCANKENFPKGAFDPRSYSDSAKIESNLTAVPQNS